MADPDQAPADPPVQKTEDMFYYQNCNKRLGPQQMNYHFSISLKNKYFFCEVAKSGCSAVKKELWRQEMMGVPLPDSFVRANHEVHGHFHHHLLVKPFQMGQDTFNEFIRSTGTVKWAVVRNPFTRILSGYLDKVKRNEPQFSNIAPRIAQLRDVAVTEIDSSTVSFEEYCDALALFDRPMAFDQHWRPQYEHLCADILPYDFFVTLETLDQEAESIAKRVGLAALNFGQGRSHATGSDSRISEFYTPRAADIVRQVYANDFTHFGYSHDLPA